MYDFVFLRHGRSMADDEKKCEGRYDSPLTEKGKAQARAAGEGLKAKGREFDAILSSPLSRALETARIIDGLYSLGVEIEPLLIEHDNGIIAGMPKSELNEKYPLPAFDSPYRYFPEHSGENAVMEHARAALALNALVDRPEGRYLVVSHGGILNALLRNAVGAPCMVNGSGLSFWLKDDGYVRVIYDRDRHHWIIAEMGDFGG